MKWRCFRRALLATIVARLSRVKSGDIIIAHMNRPESDTAEGLSIGLQKLLGRGFRFVMLRETEVRLLPDTERDLSVAPRTRAATRERVLRTL